VCPAKLFLEIHEVSCDRDEDTHYIHCPLIVEWLVLAQYLGVLDVLGCVRKLAFVPFWTLFCIDDLVGFRSIRAFKFNQEWASEEG
jgi:hypothetical protein